MRGNLRNYLLQHCPCLRINHEQPPIMQAQTDDANLKSSAERTACKASSATIMQHGTYATCMQTPCLSRQPAMTRAPRPSNATDNTPPFSSMLRSTMPPESADTSAR